MADNVASSVLVTGISQGVRLLTQILSLIVLSRLLRPEDFGLVAMVTPFYGLVLLFQDMGLGQAAVQTKSITPSQVSFLFWVSVAVGLVLALIVVIISPAVGWFYHNRQVSMLLMCMSAVLFTGVIGSLSGAILTRRMQFGRLALIDAASAVGGLAASIVFALLAHNFWALYVGMAVSTVISTVAVVVVARWMPGRPQWEPTAGSMLRFGAGVTGFNIANFVSRNLDNTLIGRRWGDVPLGLYDRAYKLLLFPLQQVTNPIAKVIVPALSRLADQPQRYNAAFIRAYGLMLLLTMPGIAFTVTNADAVVNIAMGPKWAGVVPIFQMLGLAGLLQVINNPTGWIFISQGRTKLYAIWGVVSAVTSSLAFFAGIEYGPKGVAIGYAVGEFLRTPFLWFFLTRNGSLRLSDAIRILLPFTIAAVGALLATWLVRQYVVLPSPLAKLFIAIVVSYAVMSGLVACTRQGRALLVEGLGLGQKLLLKIGKR